MRYSVVDMQAEPISVQLDLIIQLNGDKLLYPFKRVDMDVNALLWTNDSMIVNPNEVHNIGYMHNMYTRNFAVIYTALFENILAKKAKCTRVCSSRRICKMKKQGWVVHYEYEKIQISNEPYEGVCVLCQETIEGYHSTFGCKCAHICMPCLRKHYAAIPRCTICKEPVDQESLYNDVRIYNAIQYDIQYDEDTPMH